MSGSTNEDVVRESTLRLLIYRYDSSRLSMFLLEAYASLLLTWEAIPSCEATEKVRAKGCLHQAGAGGVDACDWAERLERMYLRWCDSRKYRTIIQERAKGVASSPTKLL